MKKRVVFLCGDRSKYGLAHLAPTIREFSVDAIVIPDKERWRIFRESLVGEDDSLVEKSYLPRIKRTIARLVKFLDKPRTELSSDKEVLKTPIAENNVPIIVAHDVNSQNMLDKIRSFNPELILCAAYPQILSNQLISIAKDGAVNFHPSLLPKYRGAHPHFWCIARGETRGGVTAHFMTDVIDGGDIIEQIPFEIKDVYYSELYDKIVQLTPNLVKNVALFFESSSKKAFKQNENDATYFKNDREIHHRVFWNTMSSNDIYNLIRTEKAFCFFGDRRMNILRANLKTMNRNMTNNLQVEPATIIDIHRNGFVVSTIDTCYIEINGVSFRRMDVQELIRREFIRIGVKLG